MKTKPKNKAAQSLGKKRWAKTTKHQRSVHGRMMQMYRKYQTKAKLDTKQENSGI